MKDSVTERHPILEGDTLPGTDGVKWGEDPVEKS